MTAELSAKFRDKVTMEPNKRVKNARCWSVPDFRAIHAGGKPRNGSARRVSERAGIVGARSRKHSVVACDSRAHPEKMKEPRPKRSKKPRLKIEVEERLRLRLVVPAQEFN